MNEARSRPPRSVLVTGAGGYIGHQLVERLARDRRALETIVACDVRLPADEQRLEGVEYQLCDVRAPRVVDIVRRNAVDVVVHLAAIVTPRGGDSADVEYSVDVLGTQNVVDACLAAGVRKLIVTSSGAAYGYHADNAEVLSETDPLRGNDRFPYSHNKRLVEEMLARCRDDHPELAQLVLRPGTILGESTANQITAIFERRAILGICHAPTPFVFIWDHDVVECLVAGVHGGQTGVFNLAGDGVLTLREIARRIEKPYFALPAWLVAGVLNVLHPLGLSPYGPEQIDFLRYRPVLSNERLKRDFGFIPELTSAEAFDLYWRAQVKKVKKVQEVDRG